MVGNDIVDLESARSQSNWERKGFLNKIFTSSEQECIHNAENPFLTVWLLWSMKESAYKINVQQYTQRFFAPKKLECRLNAGNKGLVYYKSNRYYTTSEITNNFIFTSATLIEEQDVTTTCFKLESLASSESEQTYHKLKLLISENYKVSIHAINIIKNSVGVPQLYLNNQVLHIPLSLTHHGDYGAVSILN